MIKLITTILIISNITFAQEKKIDPVYIENNDTIITMSTSLTEYNQTYEISKVSGQFSTDPLLIKKSLLNEDLVEITLAVEELPLKNSPFILITIKDKKTDKVVNSFKLGSVLDFENHIVTKLNSNPIGSSFSNHNRSISTYDPKTQYYYQVDIFIKDKTKLGILIKTYQIDEQTKLKTNISNFAISKANLLEAKKIDPKNSHNKEENYEVKLPNVKIIDEQKGRVEHKIILSK